MDMFGYSIISRRPVLSLAIGGACAWSLVIIFIINLPSCGLYSSQITWFVIRNDRSFVLEPEIARRLAEQHNRSIGAAAARATIHYEGWLFPIHKTVTIEYVIGISSTDRKSVIPVVSDLLNKNAKKLFIYTRVARLWSTEYFMEPHEASPGTTQTIVWQGIASIICAIFGTALWLSMFRLLILKVLRHCAYHRWRRLGRCTRCGYDVSSCAIALCPECGRLIHDLSESLNSRAIATGE